MGTYVLQANFCDGVEESFPKGGPYLVWTRRNSGWLNFTPLIDLGSLIIRICVLHVNFCDRRCWGLLKGGLHLVWTRRNSGWLNFTPLIALGSLIIRICVLHVKFCDWCCWGSNCNANFDGNGAIDLMILSSIWCSIIYLESAWTGLSPSLISCQATLFNNVVCDFI